MESLMDIRLDGKAALITGGSEGLGRQEQAGWVIGIAAGYSPKSSFSRISGT